MTIRSLKQILFDFPWKQRPPKKQEWQARQREKTKELRRMQREEEEEEERKIEEYREIGLRLKEFPEEDLRKARKLVSSFITAAEEVEEVKYFKKLTETSSS